MRIDPLILTAVLLTLVVVAAYALILWLALS